MAEPEAQEAFTQYVEWLLEHSVDRDSSPGYPYMRVYKTNGDFIDAMGKRAIAECVIQRVLALSQEAEPEKKEASYFVSRGLADPVRLFVKGELHSLEKIQEGRMRLIASVSLVDQLVERLLCGRQNNAEIARWRDIPSKPGLGLDDDGLEVLRGNAAAFVKPLATDMSGFDWSVPQWLLELDATARCRLSGASSGGAYEMALRARVAALGRSLLVLSDGTMFAQVDAGVQKSGSYNTSSSNSRMRVGLGHIAKRRASRGVETQVGIMAAGDDCIEDADGVDTSMLLAAYRSLGFSVKVSPVLDFCSYVFEKDGYSRPRKGKIAASLFTKAPADAVMRDTLLCALDYDLRHEIDFLKRVRGAIDQVGWGLVKNDE